MLRRLQTQRLEQLEGQVRRLSQSSPQDVSDMRQELVQLRADIAKNQVTLAEGGAMGSLALAVIPAEVPELADTFRRTSEVDELKALLLQVLRATIAPHPAAA
jgi:hypothetical protein